MSRAAPKELPRRLAYFSPLRYPGGKGKLAAYIKRLMEANRLLDGEYVEPYAGGAAVALELLFQEYVSRIHINDISRPVHAFWTSVLRHTDELCRLVTDTPLTVKAWDRQKRVIQRQSEHDDLAVGFAMFFLNRTNRSGILNGGIIGGLVHRIQSIARMKDRINLTGRDALKFLKTGVSRWPRKMLIYLDPPYYVKGRDLYYDYYEHEDHERLAKFVTEKILSQRWIVSYDNVQPIRSLYAGSRLMAYDIGYTARSASRGSEVMFFCDGLEVPSLIGPVNPTPQSGRFSV